MSNIQPFEYQKSTNIEEHNQIVNKVNEIVEVINDVNLDTINSEIDNLKRRADKTDSDLAGVQAHDIVQDTEIDGLSKSLVSDVTATFDNSSRELSISVEREDATSIDAKVVIPASSETGQYSAGNGITIQDYQIAVDSEVVALKTDIPVVPDVTEINNRLDTVDSEISGIMSDITDINNKNTEQDTAIAGKVAISQGSENAGKVLGIGSDGNVTPVESGGSGGEVWEEVDFSNWPTNWEEGDRIKYSLKAFSYAPSPPSSWTDSIAIGGAIQDTDFVTSPVIETVIGSGNTGTNYIEPVSNINITDKYIGVTIFKIGNITYMNLDKNDTNTNRFSLTAYIFNGGGSNSGVLQLNLSNIGDYVYKMWRLKKA